MLRVGVPQTVHVRQTGSERVTLVDPHLLNVVSITRYERTKAGQIPCSVEYVSLCFSSDRDRTILTALRPTRFQEDVVATIGKVRLELVASSRRKPKAFCNSRLMRTYGSTTFSSCDRVTD